MPRGQVARAASGYTIRHKSLVRWLLLPLFASSSLLARTSFAEDDLETQGVEAAVPVAPVAAPPAPVAEPPAPVAPPPAAPGVAPPASRGVRPQPEAFAASSPPESKHRLRWRFPRFRWWEYAAAGLVTAGNLSLEWVYRHEVEYTWTKPLPGDAAVRNWLRADTVEGRSRASDVSDYIWYGTTYYALLDGLLTPLVSDRLNTDVAFQLTLLNWQAIGLTGVLVRLVHVGVGRARPSLQNCSSDPAAENPCEFRGASFVGGHAMMTSANAGLACANHHYLPLYGGGLADSLVCPVLVTAALTVGTLRFVSDKHWLTDTVPSWLLGGAIGFGMPYLLHYRYVRDVVSPLPNTALLPWANATSAGLDFMGQL